MRKIIPICLLLTTIAMAQDPAYPYSVNENWTLSTTPLAQVSGQNIYRAPWTTACGTYAKLNSTLLANNATSYTDSSVVNGSSYCYAVTAMGTNGAESGYSNIDTNVAIPPAPPTGATATVALNSDGVDHDVILAWTNPNCCGLVANTVYNGSTRVLKTYPITYQARLYRVPSGHYLYGITDIGTGGESGLSNQASVTVP